MSQTIVHQLLEVVRHELRVLATGPLNRPAAYQAMGIGEQHDLKQYLRALGAWAEFVITGVPTEGR